MRAISRWCKRQLGELMITGRRNALGRELAEIIGGPVKMRSSGARGRDSIYFLEGAAGFRGVLRLANPHKRRKPLPADSPFTWPDTPTRLAREWAAYERGSAARLAPAPLWRCDDALVCERVAGPRLSDLLAVDPHRFWALIGLATAGICRLHDCGLVHMDCCLANIIQVENDDSLRFIDFEYGPAPELSLQQQQAYDYLRLVESSLKFRPAEDGDGIHDWLKMLDASVSPDTRKVAFESLYPALGRLRQAQGISPLIARVFDQWQPLLAAGQAT